MKIQDMTKEQFIKTMNKVEADLTTRPTKSQVITTLSDLGHCSPKSAGFEKTLLKVATSHGFVPPRFAALMGTRPITQTPETTHPWIGKPTVQTTGQPTESLPDVPQSQSKKNPVARRLVTVAPQFKLSGTNPSAISVVTFFKDTTVYLKDGDEQQKSALTPSSLEKDCTVIHLGS